MTVASRTTFEETKTALFARGYEVDAAAIVDHLKTTCDLRFLDDLMLCLPPWLVLKETFLGQTKPEIKDDVKQDDLLAEEFWLTFAKERTFESWMAELRRVEPKIELLERAILEVQNKIAMNSAMNVMDRIISLERIVKEFGGGVISRKRLEAQDSSPWMQMRVFKGQFLFLKGNGQEIRTTEEHFRTWFTRLKQDIERERHLNLCGFIPRNLLRSFRTGFTLLHEQISS